MPTMGFSDWSGEWGEIAEHHMIPDVDYSIVRITKEEHKRYHEVAIPAEEPWWFDQVQGMLRRAGLDAVTDGETVVAEGIAFGLEADALAQYRLQGYDIRVVEEQTATGDAFAYLVEHAEETGLYEARGIGEGEE